MEAMDLLERHDFDPSAIAAVTRPLAAEEFDRRFSATLERGLSQWRARLAAPGEGA